jgi:hypothetical protein
MNIKGKYQSPIIDLTCMSARTAAFIIAIFCLAGLIAAPIASAQAMPHVVFGTVRDEGGMPVAGAMVTIRNQRTGDVLTETTNYLGRYGNHTDLSAMPDGYIIGDVIKVTAVSGNLAGSSTFTVSDSPNNLCNIVVSEKSGMDPILLGGMVIGIIAIVVIAALYLRKGKEPSKESKKGRRRE